jgi:hypothetical protein
MVCIKCLLDYFIKQILKTFQDQSELFFGAGGANKNKYHFVKWRWICKPRCKGGLGVKDLNKFNISLMCKWW